MTSPIVRTVTYDEALAALQAVVAELGEDFVYTDHACHYIDKDETPSCGVGHVYVRLNLKDEMLRAIDVWQEDQGVPVYRRSVESDYQPRAGRLAELIARRDGVVLDREADLLLGMFQGYQDGRNSWGESLRLAVARIEGDRLRQSGIIAA